MNTIQQKEMLADQLPLSYPVIEHLSKKHGLAVYLTSESNGFSLVLGDLDLKNLLNYHVIAVRNLFDRQKNSLQGFIALNHLIFCSKDTNLNHSFSIKIHSQQGKLSLSVNLVHKNSLEKEDRLISIVEIKPQWLVKDSNIQSIIQELVLSALAGGTLKEFVGAFSNSYYRSLTSRISTAKALAAPWVGKKIPAKLFSNPEEVDPLNYKFSSKEIDLASAIRYSFVKNESLSELQMQIKDLTLRVKGENVSLAQAIDISVIEPSGLSLGTP